MTPSSTGSQSPLRLVRRSLLGLAAGAVALPGRALAQATPAADGEISITDLWPQGAPGGERVTAEEQVVLRRPDDPEDTAFMHVRRPWLMMRRPPQPNGAAVLIIPGGGYRRVAVRRNGGSTDAWLARLGVTAFVMNYRLPADGWAAGPDVSLHDAQRAIRLIRSRAPALGLDAARVGVLGFSAGGHVAARLATRFAAPTYAPVDEADRLSSRPSVAGLMFPVITMTQPFAHRGSAQELLGAAPSDALRRALSAEIDVPADTPPVFLAAAADDATVPVENSMMMWQALRAANVPTELHLFESGGHALTEDIPAGDERTWMRLFRPFTRRHGLLTSSSA